MFGSLDASNFSSSSLLYEKQFEDILSKITICYQLMKVDKVILENDENKIRDVLVDKYINKPEIKKQIKLEYFVLSEVPETNTTGRTDIRIQPPNTFYEQEAYYIIECKRLDSKYTDGTSGLNAKYIKNGMDRFISKRYSSYHRVNGMIGFIVDDLEIHSNTKSINSLLLNSFKSINTNQEITRCHFINDFEYHYHSTHVDKDNDELKIYHLMFDLDENIQR